jgi:hypothetical protein
MDHGSAINQWVGNAFSIGAIAATFMGWVPGVAALVALIWYSIQIFESATVQRWLANRRARRIAHLKAQVLLLEARNRMPPLDRSTFDDPDSSL